MPRSSWIIPDGSPLISYVTPTGDPWGDSDQATQSYVNQTFHFTDKPGATATFAFNGTGISIHGALRGNHGQYQVKVDSDFATYDGHRNPDLFDQTMSNNDKLPYGHHTAVLTNVPSASGSFVDIDYLVVEAGDGDNQTTNVDSWLDDTHPNITYSAGWSTTFNTAGYLQNTGHSTCTTGANATISFRGNLIALYGGMSTDYGQYTVTVDGASLLSSSANTAVPRQQIPLYFASGLDFNQHTLVLTNKGGTANSNCISVDFAVVSSFSTNSTNVIGSDLDPKHSTTTKPGSSTPIGPIIGGVVGGIAILAAGIIGFWLWRRRKSSAAATARIDKSREAGSRTDVLGHEHAPLAMGGAAGASSYSLHHNSAGGPHPGFAPGGGPPGGPEMDMPPPDYDRVFSAPGSSSGGGSAGRGGAASEAGYSASAYSGGGGGQTRPSQDWSQARYNQGQHGAGAYGVHGADPQGYGHGGYMPGAGLASPPAQSEYSGYMQPSQQYAPHGPGPLSPQSQYSEPGTRLIAPPVLPREKTRPLQIGGMGPARS